MSAIPNCVARAEGVLSQNTSNHVNGPEELCLRETLILRRRSSVTACTLTLTAAPKPVVSGPSSPSGSVLPQLGHVGTVGPPTPPTSLTFTASCHQPPHQRSPPLSFSNSTRAPGAHPPPPDATDASFAHLRFGVLNLRLSPLALTLSLALVSTPTTQISR